MLQEIFTILLNFSTSMDDLVFKIALTLVPKVGPITARQLLSYAGSPEEVFRCSKKILMRIPGIGPAIADSICSHSVLHQAEKELQILTSHGIKPVFITDEAYPGRLRHFPDSPLLLFFQGSADLNPLRCISVIGTRKPTPYGMAFCEELLHGLWAFSPTIVSGLAYGIDITAHRKAIELGLPTIGVMAHGHGHFYPPDHRPVGRRMLENGGLMSEYTFHTSAAKEYFPLRNRIVAGICDALIVVETGTEGGSMITAQFANDYNKDVFAVPGRAKDPGSAGCNLLIKTHRAHLLESPEDLVQAMSWDQDQRRVGVQQLLFGTLEPEEKKIVDLLRQKKEAAVDDLVFGTGNTPGTVAALLLDLELKGILKSLPGKRYALRSDFLTGDS